MRLVRLGRSPVLGTELRITNDLKTGELVRHRHWIFRGWHLCFQPKAPSRPTDPIALFGHLCRK